MRALPVAVVAALAFLQSCSCGGPAGACKTTADCSDPAAPHCAPMLGACVACLDDTMCPAGQVCNGAHRDIGMVFQEESTFPWRTVLDNVAFPLELAGIEKSERVDRADQVIKHVGLDGFAHRYPHELSGGMRKRVCLARMLVYGAETALLDEPFAALDAQLKLAMHDLLLKLAAETGQTVVLVTHDLMEAVTLADRVLVCTRRPATLALEQHIALKRPRDVLNVRFTNEFKELYDALWERLRVEYQEERV